jgi:uncharacterized protein YqhQ
MQNHYLGGQAEDNGITVFNNIKQVSIARLNDDSINISITSIQNSKIINLVNNIIVLRGFFKLIHAMLIDRTNKQERFRGFLVSISFLMIFIVSPAFIHFLSHLIEKNVFIDLLEGLIRIIGFLLFLFVIKFLPSTNQLLKNHAAEHMAINAFENNKQLTVPAIRRDSKKNIRCGTNYFFILTIIYLIVFLILPQGNYGIEGEIVIRILILPLIAGIANECLIIISKLNNKIQSKIFKPLLLLQELTTMHPDDQHLQSAIAAIKILQSKVSIGEYKLNNYAELDKLLNQ